MALACKAADAEYLAGVQLSVTRRASPGAVQVARLEHGRSPSGCSRRQLGVERSTPAAGHQLDRFVLVELVEGADVAAVAEDGDPVGDVP